jgi:hypothetical protein
VIDERDDTDRFRVLVAQLELARDLVASKNEGRCRAALILLDALAELILVRIMDNEFQRDDYTRRFTKEEYPASRRRHLEQSFPAKVEMAESAYRLKRADTVALLVVHRYRNQTLHRDTHNPRILPLLARVALISTLKLFTRTRGGIQTSAVGGFKRPVRWLKAYKLKTPPLWFDEAAAEIAKTLARRLRPRGSTVANALASDITSRVAAIRETLEQELPNLTIVDINHMIKWFEWHEHCRDDEARISGRYRSLLSRVARGKKVSREVFVEAENTYRDQLLKSVESYQPSFTHAALAAIEAELPTLRREKTYSRAIERYAEADSRLSMFERIGTLAYREWDRRVQQEIDIRRGK